MVIMTLAIRRFLTKNTIMEIKIVSSKWGVLMIKFGDILQLLQRNKVVYSPKNKKGNNESNNAKVANTMFNFETHLHIDNLQLEKSYETVINNDSTIEFREKILPIEILISEGKPLLAIKEYEELTISHDFSNYSKDEKFLIYNGLLNCFINIDSDDGIIKKWSIKIDALGEDIKEIHRYYYILSIWKYKKREFDNAIILNNQAIKAKPDYINALTGNILLKATNKDISYDEAKKQFDEMFKNSDLTIKEKANVYAILGDVAFNYQDFPYAKECYLKSNEYSKSVAKEIGIAICDYFDSISNIKEDGTVTLENIDYTKLKKAEERFEAIYNDRTEDTIYIISKLMFSYLFNILSVSNKQKRILEIINESYIDYKNPEILKLIVEAEVINGIYNEETFSHLSEYEKVKYKSIYFEIKKEYKSQIELLLPILENDYQDDMILQLSLLNALKEDNQFERYLHYYKKFTKDENDEVYWMNYVQFLVKHDEKDKAISEMKKLKKVAKNSLVLYDLLAFYLEYNLTDELDEFFIKVDNGDFRIVGLQMPFVLYNRLMHLLKTEKYEEFFSRYENSKLEIFSPISKAILDVNYYTFKGDLDKTAKSYYELFKISEDHNDLLKAVGLKLNSNSLYDAEMYLEHINPMLLDKPELFYIYNAIILNEKGKVNDAFEKLHEIIDFVKDDLDSPFHQFYTAFCMNNGRVDDAFKYMAEYYAKNPDPNWFKVIQHSEDETGEQMIKKLEIVVGGKRDTSQINYYFNQGVIGISVYNKLLGTSIEDMLIYQHYPFTNVNIANGNVQKALSEVDKIKNQIIVDTATLTILSEAKGLSLLDCFDAVLIPYNTITLIKQRETGIHRSASKSILKYINASMNIKQVPVEVGLKIKGKHNELLPEDTLDCIALSEKLEIPFLNTEVSIDREFNPNYIVDVNSFFLYMKANRSEKREEVAEAIGMLRRFKTEFISFDADDICINYSLNGLEGIKPFLRMGKNADYKTFVQAYVSSLLKLKQELAIKEFEILASEFIKFIDAYVGKTRYYMSSIIQNYPEVKNDFEKLIMRCSVKEILSANRTYRINIFNRQAYIDILDSYDFTKIISIASSFVGFVIQFLARFGKTSQELEYYIGYLKENLRINSAVDIDYIVETFSPHFKDQIDE